MIESLERVRAAFLGHGVRYLVMLFGLVAVAVAMTAVNETFSRRWKPWEGWWAKWRMLVLAVLLCELVALVLWKALP